MSVKLGQPPSVWVGPSTAPPVGRSTTVPGLPRNLLLPAAVAACPGCGTLFGSTVTLSGPGDTLETSCCGKFTVFEGIDHNIGRGQRFYELRHVGRGLGHDNARHEQALHYLAELYDQDGLGRLDGEAVHVTVFGEPFTLALDHPDNVTTRLARFGPRADTAYLGRVREGGRAPNVVVRDGHHPSAIADAEPELEHRCRWCAGDGLDAMLSNRIRWAFRVALPYDEAFGPLAARGTLAKLVCVPPISPWHPLNEWLAKASVAGWTPWPSINRDKRDVECPRCHGSGEEP